MPNLNDIMEMAELLETKAVYVTPDRCVTVRNRNASCRRCLEACPVDGALTLGMNKLDFNYMFCVSCGACTTVCPTEALAPTKPLDRDLAQSIAEATENAGGHAVFACARVSSHGKGNPEKYAEVPCLGRVEECLLLNAAADGARAITLVDGNCHTCKYRFTSAGTTDTVDSANTLLEAWGSPVRVERSSAWPEEAVLRDDDTLALGESRRAFFMRGKERVKKGAASTALKALKHGEKIPTLRERLRVAKDGALPHFEAERRPSTLDALDRMGQPQEDEIFTRLWGSVEIDAEACSGCRMCTVFCPTGALKMSEEKPEGEGQYLEFSVADCVQCDSCADICLKKCLTVEPVVRTSELMDFEPRFIWIPEMQKNNLLGRNLLNRNKK